MGAPVYSFRNSDANTSSQGIEQTMEDILTTLGALGEDISALEPAWVADEAEMYYEAARNWKEGATSIADILEQVRMALHSVRDGTDELREGITKVLNETS